jgi:hypothetical protein
MGQIQDERFVFGFFFPFGKEGTLPEGGFRAKPRQ